MPDDRAIIEKCLKGDRVALNELFRPYGGRVYGLCYQMVGHREDALDLSQEVFLRAMRGLSSFDKNRPFFPWLKKIAVNTCINHLRRKEKFPFYLEDNQSAALDTKSRPVDKALEDMELREAVKQTLDGLPPVMRVVVVLRHYQSFSYREVAEATGLPLGTVKTYLFRARDILKKNLAGIAGMEVR